MHKDSSFSTYLPTVIIFWPWPCVIGARCYFTLVLICISLIISDSGYVSICFVHSYIFWETSIQPFDILIELFFVVKSCRSSLCTLGINSLSGTWFANIFSHFISCLFTLLFSWLNRNFKFDIALFLYCLCFRYCIQEVTAKSSINAAFLLFSSKTFSSYV